MGDDKNKKSWLILAHCFNMDGRAASQTITDRLPYFIDAGISFVVLSAPTGKKDNRFPHYQVISAFPSGLLFEGRQIISQKVKSKSVRSLLKALLTLVLFPFYLIEILTIYFDSQWSWSISATLKGIWIIKKHRPSLIYSSAGPASTHVAAFFLKILFGLPWLAEVHDPLIYDKEPRKGRFHYFKKWLEKKIFRHAGAVIYFTHSALAHAQRRNKGIGNGVVLRPGAEPPGFSEIFYAKRDTIHFGHFGSLADNRNLSLLFQAVYELTQVHPGWKEIIRIDVYGADLDSVSRQSLTRFPLGGILSEHGRLEYDPVSGKSGRQRVLKAMGQSDVLILVHGEGIICQEYIPSKLYEYLLTGRPVLGIAEEDSELSQMLMENNCQYIGLADLESLKGAITDYIGVWQKGGIPSRKGRSPFTVKRAADKIISIAGAIQEAEMTEPSDRPRAGTRA